MPPQKILAVRYGQKTDPSIQPAELFGRRRSSAISNRPNTSLLAYTLSGLSPRREESKTQDDIRGSHGLSLLYSPPVPIVDFIFVHVLGRGWRKTWSKEQDLMSSWLRIWVPQDREFKHVRIQSFRYDSDWSECARSPLNIHDFGKSHLGAISGIVYLRSKRISPFCFSVTVWEVWFSRKFYVQVQQDPAFNSTRKRFRANFFQGTPHRGASLAQELMNIFQASCSGSKAFVAYQLKQPAFLQSINDKFGHCVEGMQLFSFYETKPMKMMMTSEIIVTQDSATAGYPQEWTALMNADHRGMTKFDNAEDPSFIFVRLCYVLKTASEMNVNIRSDRY